MQFHDMIMKEDNLTILRDMESNSVDCIATDVLYGSGQDFGDYHDLPFEKQAVDDFYYPRIREMHRVLKPTGSLFLMCDWHADHWLRCILEDIMGRNSYRNHLIWYYADTLKSSKARHFPRNHDSILFYAKTPDAKFFPLRIPREDAIRRGKIFHDPETKRALYDRDEHGKIQYVDYTDVLVDSVWVVGKTCVANPNSSEYVNYATQKPEELFRRCIASTTQEGDFVVDFFMGSGSCCSVAYQHNRHYFGCDIGEKAYQITQQRMNDLVYQKEHSTLSFFETYDLG